MSKTPSAPRGAGRDRRFDAAIREIARAFGIPSVQLPAKWDRAQGRASAQAHFGELFQGAWPHAAAADGPAGLHRTRFPHTERWLTEAAPLRRLPFDSTRCLIDLPCPILRSSADIVLYRASAVVADSQHDAFPKARCALQAVLGLFGVDELVEAQLMLTSNIPKGKGCGSSSADVVATIRATCDALGRSLSDDAMGMLLCLVEKASNPVHLVCPAVFAHRNGLVLRTLGQKWPPFLVLGVDAGGTVATDAFTPMHYGEDELRVHSVMLEALSHGFRTGDSASVARVATAIARSDGRLPHDHDRLSEWVHRFSALGYCVSHSGTVAALLWQVDAAGSAGRAQALVEVSRNVSQTWQWSL